MKTVLVISSFVAASHVGATASAFCLRRLGHEAIILPTTLMGRHPGWGNPGGGATETDKLRAMWEAIKAQGLTIDAVLTGYMGAREHITLAAEIIADVKDTNPDAVILVDPVMGDAGRLYIPKDRAEAIRDILVPLADVITPNLWELSYLTEEMDIIKAASQIAANVLVTSVPHGPDIGAAFISDTARYASHKRFSAVPHGGGDSLAGIFLAHILSGQEPISAMAQSVAAVFTMMQAANETDAGELPIIRTQESWVAAAPLSTAPYKA